ncbi:MAG TPA: type II toxin-antitoxin system VapC family toxin [Flavisolibacter sp.]|nr:type II toxin-antitoxin system VapC family toxin [Flavisolibacter sp.]
MAKIPAMDLPQSYIFDTNFIDAVISGEIDTEAVDAFRRRINGTYFITHVQVDEMNRTPDEEKRAQMFLRALKLKFEIEPTSSFIIGYSRIEEGEIGEDDGLYERLMGENIRHVEDAMIGETAIKNGMTLVTGDIRLYKAVKREGGQVIYNTGFAEMVKRVVGMDILGEGGQTE